MPRKPPRRSLNDPERWKDESGALREALRAVAGRKGPPSDADSPPVRPFPGRKHKPLPGQLELVESEESSE